MNPEDYIEKRDVRRMDRFCHFALASSRQAINDSGIKFEEDSYRSGVIIGCGIGGFLITENQHKILMEKEIQSKPFYYTDDYSKYCRCLCCYRT